MHRLHGLWLASLLAVGLAFLAAPAAGQPGRSPSPGRAAALRRQVEPKALLRAMVGLMADGDLAQVPRLTRKALSKLAARPARELRNAKTQRAVLARLQAILGEEAYTEVVGGRVSAARAAARLLDQESRKNETADMNRGWGWRLLPEEDKAFSDPQYLSGLMRESGQSGAGMVGNSPTNAERRFWSAWRRIAPENTQPVAYTLTGTDANNLLYSIALKAARKRLKDPAINDAEILVFDSCFAGARGRIANAGFLKMGGPDGPTQEHVKITSPHSYAWKPESPAEIARLEQLEAKALAQIENKVKTSATPIGGILVEPIIGAKGVLFYRPEFMTKLRELTDRLGVPIFADEILTGGGRTGKFFAYQHYDGFEPDFVTFGKGLQVSGIATVYRRSGKGLGLDFLNGDTTLTHHSEALLKGAQVLERIRRDNLIENAARIGEYMRKKIAAMDRADLAGHTPDQDTKHAMGPTRGMGLLIYSTNLFKGVSTAMARLLPPLTISKAEVDRLFARKNFDKYLDQVKSSADSLSLPGLLRM